MKVEADAIRGLCIEAGAMVRDKVQLLPDSPSRTVFLAITSELEDFWLNRASDEFCQQWLTIAMETGS